MLNGLRIALAGIALIEVVLTIIGGGQSTAEQAGLVVVYWLLIVLYWMVNGIMDMDEEEPFYPRVGALPEPLRKIPPPPMPEKKAYPRYIAVLKDTTTDEENIKIMTGISDWIKHGGALVIPSTTHLEKLLRIADDGTAKDLLRDSEAMQAACQELRGEAER